MMGFVQDIEALATRNAEFRKVLFRDIQDHISRLVGLIDGMRDMMTTAMQVNLALVANNQNEGVKRLAGWGAILAIPTVVFSLYGMNFEWMPELKWRAGYPMPRWRWPKWGAGCGNGFR
jgi:Mg2+ and Co2+ transporter CorA